MVYAHVIYKPTGLERKNVMPRSYELLKSKYTLLGYVDENGNPVQGPEEQAPVQKKRSQDVAPVVSKRMTPEEIEAKKAELQEMNRVAIQKALDEQKKQEPAQTPFTVNDERPQVEEKPVKQRQKPGPKPKQNA